MGLAAGDALGTTVEFSPAGFFAPLKTIVGGGPFGLKAGEWTDDTSMALCLAESLVECAGFDAEDQMRRYRRWRNEGYLSSNGRCFDIGGAVSRALAEFERTGNPYAGMADMNAAGNGSLMRIAPLALMYANTPYAAISYAAEASCTTHGAADATSACAYMTALIIGALQGESKEELLGGVYEPAPEIWNTTIGLTPKVLEVARGSFKRDAPPSFTGTGGYVVTSLEAALWAFHHTDDFREGALKVVNLGYDADTYGAIYGQLAGAYYGDAGIPEEWRSVLARRDLIESVADRVYELRAGGSINLDAPTAERESRGTHVGAPGRRTSDTDPILVNFVEDSRLNFPGRIGLTFAPGKKQPHGQSGHWDRDLDKDLGRLREEFGADTLVSLIEEHEFERLRITALRERAAAAGIESLWFPIRDRSVPASADEFAALVDTIMSRLREGLTVVIHCMGGLGRSGLVAAACLVAATEVTPEEAVRAVRAARRGAVETPEQEEFVGRYADRLRRERAARASAATEAARKEMEMLAEGEGEPLSAREEVVKADPLGLEVDALVKHTIPPAADSGHGHAGDKHAPVEPPDSISRMVQSSITSVGFPETLDEVFDMLEKNSYAGDWLSDMDTLLRFDPAAGTVWTAPKWMTEGDVLFFYHTKRGALRTAKLRNEAVRLFPRDSNIVRFLDRAAELSKKYGGKIFACAAVTGTTEYYAKESEHFDSRFFAPLGDVHVFARPLSSDDFKDFVKISQNTLTPLYAKQFDGIKRLLARGNELPAFLRGTAGGELSFRNVGRETWTELSCRPDARFIHEAQLRSYLLDFMLEELKDRGTALLEECLCVRAGVKTGFADYFVRLHGRWVPVEAKLNVLAERDLLGQVAKYVGIHSFTPTLGANRGKVYAADDHPLCLVADQSGVYVVKDGAYVWCAPGRPAWPREGMTHETVAEMRARLKELL